MNDNRDVEGIDGGGRGCGTRGASFTPGRVSVARFWYDS